MSKEACEYISAIRDLTMTVRHGIAYVTIAIHDFKHQAREFALTPDDADRLADDLKQRAQDIRSKEMT